MRILVRAPNWIGDQVLAYRFYQGLRQSFQSAWIAVACLPWVESIQFRDCVDEVIVLPDRKRADTLKKAGPWDIGICLPHSFSSAWLMYRSGAKIRRGYASEWRSFLLNEKLFFKKNQPEHRENTYLRLVPSQHSDQIKILKSCLSFSPSLSWPNACPLDPPVSPYWVLAPGSAAHSRRWPLESFLELSYQIVKKWGWSGLVVGGKKEKEIAKELISYRELKLLDYTDCGSVASYWKIFRSAQISVSNDSGLAHVASFCSPSLLQIIWGAGNPRNTQPRGFGMIEIAFPSVSCWPCEKNNCRWTGEKEIACLKGITAMQVFEQLEKAISKL